MSAVSASTGCITAHGITTAHVATVSAPTGSVTTPGLSAHRLKSESQQRHGNTLFQFVGEIIDGFGGDGSQSLDLLWGQVIIGQGLIWITKKSFAKFLIGYCSTDDFTGIFCAHHISFYDLAGT
jgi:hypothetical protein